MTPVPFDDPDTDRDGEFPVSELDVGASVCQCHGSCHMIRVARLRDSPQCHLASVLMVECVCCFHVCRLFVFGVLQHKSSQNNPPFTHPHWQHLTQLQSRLTSKCRTATSEAATPEDQTCKQQMCLRQAF